MREPFIDKFTQTIYIYNFSINGANRELFAIFRIITLITYFNIIIIGEWYLFENIYPILKRFTMSLK